LHQSQSLKWRGLAAELMTIDKQLKKLISSRAPTLIEQYGVGTYVAATLLVAAGDNPERLKKNLPLLHFAV
jgi:DNA repair protein RadC